MPAYLKDLDLTKQLQTVCRFVIDDMIKRIQGKVDINGNPVYPNAKSTIKKKGFDHRMVDSRNFIKHAFRFDAKKTVASIFINKAKHPNSKASYWQIGAWNLKGHPSQAVERASEWFGLNKSVEEKANKYLAKEIFNQIDKKLVYKEIINAVL